MFVAWSEKWIIRDQPNPVEGITVTLTHCGTVFQTMLDRFKCQQARPLEFERRKHDLEDRGTVEMFSCDHHGEFRGGCASMINCRRFHDTISRMPRKSKNEPPLLAYLDEFIAKLRESIPVAIQQHDAAAIHQSRVTTRRLAAALHVLKPILSRPRRGEFARMLRKLRRRLGPLRDLDVMINLARSASARPSPAIDVQGLQDPAHAPAISWALHHLDQQRNQRRASAVKKTDCAKVIGKLNIWRDIRPELVDSQRAMDSLLAESLHLQLDSFIAHAESISVRRAVDGDVPLRDPHELRIACKAWRYSLEMAVANGHKLPGEITRSLKKMQDALGKWHDNVVLAECLMSLSIEEQLAHHDAGLQIEVLDLAKKFLARALRSLKKFSELWNERGGEIVRTIRLTFPLTQPVDPDLFSAPKTDRGLFDSPESPADPMPEASPPDETSAV